MTDTKSRLLAAGDALAKALESSCVWCRCDDCIAVEIAAETWRALAREVRKAEESPAQLVASALKQGEKDMGFTLSDDERKRLSARLFGKQEKGDD